MGIAEQFDQFLMSQLVNVRNHAPVLFSPFGSILATIVITYACKFVAVVLGFFSGVGYSNMAPRDIKVKPFSAASRAMAAHANGFEALLLLTAAVSLGTLANLDNNMMTELTTLYVYARLAYSFVYIFVSFNEIFSYIRSAAFAVGFGVAIKIMIMAAQSQNGYVYKMK